MIVARIDDEVISAEAFVKLLKLDRQLDPLLEKVLVDKLLVYAARENDIRISPEEIQQRVDQFRRAMGLHRARDTIEFLDNIEMKTADLEDYVTEILYREKMRAMIFSESAVSQFYNSHYPAFERVGLSHIAVSCPAKAQEIFAQLEEEPESFLEMVMQHSEAQDTREQAGYLGKIPRGVLPYEVEVKVFSAKPGSLLGPFEIEASQRVEIFKVLEFHLFGVDSYLLVYFTYT